MLMDRLFVVSTGPLVLSSAPPVMVMSPLPTCVKLVLLTAPSETVRPPEKVLFPDRASAPLPVLLNPPVPVMLPDKVALRPLVLILDVVALTKFAGTAEVRSALVTFRVPPPKFRLAVPVPFWIALLPPISSVPSVFKLKAQSAAGYVGVAAKGVVTSQM